MSLSIEQANELWQRFNTFTTKNEWYRKEFEKWLRQSLPPDYRLSPGEMQERWTEFSLRAHIGGGDPLLLRFIETLPVKAEEQRAAVARWVHRWLVVGQVQEFKGEYPVLFDLVTCTRVMLTARTAPGRAPEELKGTFFIALVVPFGENAALTATAPSVLPGNAAALAEARKIALSARVEYAPEVFYRNPAQAEASIRLRRLFAHRFAAHFGTSEWFTTGARYVTELAAFYRKLEEEGRTGDRGHADYAPWHEIDLERQLPSALPPEIARSEDLALLCDENEAPALLMNYRSLCTALEGDDPEQVPGWRKLTRRFFADPGVTGLAFALPFQRNPERVVARVAMAMESTTMTREEFVQALEIAKGPVMRSARMPSMVPLPDWSAVQAPPAESKS